MCKDFRNGDVITKYTETESNIKRMNDELNKYKALFYMCAGFINGLVTAKEVRNKRNCIEFLRGFNEETINIYCDIIDKKG